MNVSDAFFFSTCPTDINLCKGEFALLRKSIFNFFEAVC
jgi:hypothetical protein